MAVKAYKIELKVKLADEHLRIFFFYPQSQLVSCFSNWILSLEKESYTPEKWRKKTVQKNSENNSLQIVKTSFEENYP